MRAARLGLVCAASLVALPGSVFAADSEDYERQINDLEARVHQLETMITELKDRQAPAPSADVDAQPGQPGRSDTAAAAGDGQKKAADQTKRELSSEDRTLVQDLFVVRDQAVALKAGRMELSNEFSYSRADGFLQKSRGFAVKPTFRYGFGHGLEMSVSTSGNWTHRESISGAAPITGDKDYLGDVDAQLNWAAVRETKDMPGFVVYGGVVIPTGPSPYVSGGALTPGKNPSSVFDYYSNTSGHYAVSAGVEAFRTFSPFALFAGFGVTYKLPKEYGGLTVAPGYTFTYNIGYTFAVSEITSLGMSVLGSYRPNMSTGGIEVPSSGSEPVSVRFSLLQKLANDFYVEPSITLGLTSDAPNSVLSLNTRYSF